MAARWQLFPKNPTLLSYNVSGETRHGCASGEPASARVCAVVLRGDYLNIGHSAQLLFRCWSWFRVQRAGERFVLVDRQPSGWPNLVSRPWQAELLRAMGATYTSKMPSGRCVAVWRFHKPLGRNLDPCPYPGSSEAWFSSSEAAWELAAAVTGSAPPPPRAAADSAWREWLRRGGAAPAPAGGASVAADAAGAAAAADAERTSPRRLRIGVLNRLGGRRSWSRAAEFARLVRRLSPEHEVSEWTMDNLSLVEQARSVRRHDIIITPHGAQNANFAFVRPCTALLEIFPPPLSTAHNAAYLLPMYLDLASEAGGVSHLLWAGNASIASPRALLDGAVRDTMEQTVGRFTRQAKLRTRRVDTPARDVYDVLGTLIDSHRSCRRRGRPLETPTRFDGLPTLGGARWLQRPGLGAAAVGEGAGGVDTCFYCNASAGCCGAGTAVDRRRVYACTACY